MALAPGSKLGVYEVTAKIGAGGMGEVYRAHDTTLDRDVAIKVLPDAFANDPERLARFEREAKVLASLNHPNIAAIYGLEKSEDTRALILELVEGPTLQDRIAQGPIPLDEALPIARQIAEALEAAHEQGIIHRDLKPANVKVKDDGTVKVLDFGLAKALQAELSDLDAANSPTMTMTAAATKMGVIMGTAAYMAPEQAAGKPADRRADIWAFGVVLWEMLTGRQLFTGESVSHVLASVLKTDPDWTALPTETPTSILRMIKRCLAKDRRERRQHIGDVRLDIKEAGDGAAVGETHDVSAPALAFWQRPLALVAGALLIAAISSLAVWSFSRPAPKGVTKFIITTSGNPVAPGIVGASMAISSDGASIVYQGGLTGRELYVRELAELEARLLEGAREAVGPFVSPDGNWVGFTDLLDGRLKKIPMEGGPVVTLGRARGNLGASWGQDGMIVFSESGPGGLLEVSEDGGEPQALTSLADDEVGHAWPEVLAGGRLVLFNVTRGSDLEGASIEVLDRDTGTRTLLVEGGGYPRYSPTGHIVYAKSGTLWAVPFDAERVTVTGSPVLVMDGVSTTRAGGASFAVASDGSLVYVSGVDGGVIGDRRSLVWVDREGGEESVGAEPRAYQTLSLSPDGTRVAVGIRDQESDVWIWDFARETLTRLTFESGTEYDPVWTPDGERVAFSGRNAVSWKAADGTGAAEMLRDISSGVRLHTFLPDGTALLISDSGPESGRDLGLLSIDGVVERLLTTSFQEPSAALSPDGRWLSVQSNASGEFEIYVHPFPDINGGQWQISTDGGVLPLWGPGGRELFYRNGQAVLAVSVQTEPSFVSGNPEVLFEGPYRLGFGSHTYDVSPDGQRFLMIKAAEPGGDGQRPELVLVQNWSAELERLVTAGQ